MSIPLKWAEGDRCCVRGQVGTIAGLDGECASVRINEWRMLFVAVDELELVPFAQASTIPAPPDEEQQLEVPHEVSTRSEGAKGPEVADPAPGHSDEVDELDEPDELDDYLAEAEAADILGMCDEDVDAELRAIGLDPQEVARKGLEFVKELSYDRFVAQKLTRAPSTGLAEVPPLHPSLFAHQRDLVAWALRRGRAALFADTGLGKTAMQLEWAKHVHDFTGQPVLILAPLAVAAQTAREGERLGIPVTVCRSQGDVAHGVNITNYDRLHRFDPGTFGGVVLDESSIIKHHDAKTLGRLLEAFDQTPFKLAATATPSPNDYTELGTHAEFLGVCTRQEMLAEYFVHDGGSTQDWRLKGHARQHFWRWVSSWAALLRKPSDLGYDDAGYDLPELRVTQHTIEADVRALNEVTAGQTSLFAEPAKTLTERRAARRGSLSERVRRCAEVVLAEPDEAWVIWCELNDEADELRKAIAGSVEIRGADEPLLKEARLVGFARGEFKVLITKPSIAGFGLNWQHAARMAFVGVKDSWESYYQSIRRCWRFGQRRAVHVHVFASELEGNVVENLRRKERDALAMAEQLGAETRDAVRAEVRGLTRTTNDYAPAVSMSLPDWLASEEAAE